MTPALCAGVHIPKLAKTKAETYLGRTFLGQDCPNKSPWDNFFLGEVYADFLSSRAMLAFNWLVAGSLAFLPHKPAINVNILLELFNRSGFLYMNL